MTTSLLRENPGLITATITPKQQIYHLVTEETLSAIKEKSIATELLMLVTSLLFGAFFSVLITIQVSIGLPDETRATLAIYKYVFLGFGCLFFSMTIYNFAMGNSILKNIKASEASLST
jgi:hypothetical protein